MFNGLRAVTIWIQAEACYIEGSCLRLPIHRGFPIALLYSPQVDRWPCRLITNQIFLATTMSLQWDVKSEDGSIMFFRNVCVRLPEDTVSNPRRPESDLSSRGNVRRHTPTRSSKKNIYRVSRGECARLRENVPHVIVHRSNPEHLYPKLNGYGDNGERKVWSSCGSTYCTCFACCYPYTAHVRPSVSQPSQAHCNFIINRCHSYSEL